MIGRTNADGGGSVTSDETTAKAGDVLKGQTYLGADTDDEAGTGTLELTGDAAAGHVLSGKTFYNTNAKTKVTGTIASMDGTVITPSASAQTISCSGKYMTGDCIVNAVSGLSAGNIKNGAAVGGVTGTYKGLGNATAAQVLSGSTFSTASLSNATGTMTNYSGYTSASKPVASTFRSTASGSYIYVSPGGNGYYTTGSYLRVPAANLTAGNIKKGVSILGITGTFQGMVDSPYYLLKSGSNHLETAAGMSYIASQVSSSTTGVKESDHGSSYIYMELRIPNSTSAGGWVLWRLSNAAISLAAYKTLYLKVTSTLYGNGPTYQRLGLNTSGSVTGNSFNAYIDIANSISQGTYSLDISSLNSSYWFYFYQQGPGTGSRGVSGSQISISELYLVS